MQTSISALYRTDSGPTCPHAPPLRQLLHHLHTVRRCHLHIAQLVWIHFNMFNLMVEIDACGRVGWSVYISSYWLAHSHVPVTGSLIGSRLLIFHSNRKQMKCPCYMQRCGLVRIRCALSLFSSLYINAIPFISSCPPSSLKL